MIKNIKSFDKTKISYVINKGIKSCLVFLHGDGSNHTVWKPFLKYFHDHSFIALDLRSHGNSSEGRISIENFSKDLKEIFKREKIENAVLIGNCLGATIAFDFYKRFPELTEKLILISPFSSETIRFSFLLNILNDFVLLFAKIFKSKRKLKFQNYDKNRTPLILRPTVDLKGTRLKTYLSSLKNLFEYKLGFSLIKTRTLIIAASKDYFIKKRKIRKMIKNNENISFRITDSTHLLLTRNPEKMIREVNNFIK